MSLPRRQLFTLLGGILALPAAWGVRRWNENRLHDSHFHDSHSHSGDSERMEAIEALRGKERQQALAESLNAREASQRLVTALLLESEPLATIQALLPQAIRDNDSEVRIKALRAGFRLSDPERIDFTRAALQDEDTWVRQETLQWLNVQRGWMNNQGLVFAHELVACALDPDYNTNSTAILILSKMTGKPWRIHKSTPPTEVAAVQARWQEWAGKHPPSKPVPPLRIVRTDPAPDISFTTIEGDTLLPTPPEGFRLMNFWGTWCPPCRMEIPYLQRLYASRTVDVVGIALAEPKGAEGVRTWCKEQGITYPQALATEALTEAFQDIHDLPVTVLLDSGGKIRRWWRGERDLATFQRAIEAVKS